MLLGRLSLSQVGRREFHCRFRLGARSVLPLSPCLEATAPLRVAALSIGCH